MSSFEISKPTNQGAISRWTAEHVAAIADALLPTAPLIDAEAAKPLLADYDLWDVWPLQNPDGSIAVVAGGELWMVLSAPRQADPDARHDIARTRLLFRQGGTWRDCGTLFPDHLNPGSREWSGSALYDETRGAVTAYFTVAGRRGEAAPSFEQRLFFANGLLDLSWALPAINQWTKAKPLVANDGTHYVDLAKEQGVAGNIRGFRDPYWFDDPADNRAYILFTGSQPGGVVGCDGVIGIASALLAGSEPSFQLMPPILSADGVANELERPHMLVRNGLYYLFWSSQRSIFAPDGPRGPTGLYGMVGTSVTGPFKPLNETGLVIANPIEEPRQAYCWQVLNSLEVVSFVDHWGLQGRDTMSNPDLNRLQFGGTIAPMLKIELIGSTTRLLGLA